MPIRYPELGYEELFEKSFGHKPEKRVDPSQNVSAGHQAVGGENGEIRALFHLALETCGRGYAEGAVEFDLHQLGGRHNVEEMVLLFDLALEALDNPEGAQRYIEQIRTSSETEVEAKSLTQELAKVESVIEAPLFSLKGIRKGVQESSVKTESDIPVGQSQVKVHYVDASARKRLQSGFIDGLLVLSVALVITLVSSNLGLGDLFHLISDRSSSLVVQTLPAMSLFIEVATLLTVLYPIVTLGLFRCTLGQKLLGLKVLRDNGHRIGLENVVVRSLVLPISPIASTVSKNLPAGRTFHDHIARTMLVMIAEEVRS